ncbi:MAG TPA: T9SS type A sorting domain-containing protein [Candidatus Cloacimonas sp.]|nr:T9SS type A sorting domain-containing protein [Candidatus Cloacimonas sp.]
MKRTILLLILLGSMFICLANPLPPMIMNKFWFNDAGELQVRYSSMYLGAGILTADLFDGSNHFLNTIDFSSIDNITLSYPNANVTPYQGYLSASLSIFSGWQEEVHWGPSLDNDISSLAEGECGMNTYWTYQSGHDENTVTIWTKELQTYLDSEMYPVARCNLDVFCQDFSGAPVEGIPVWLYDQTLGYTNDSGHYTVLEICRKNRIIVNHPATQTAVLDTLFFAEPNQSYNFNVLFFHGAADDPHVPTPTGVLSLYPSVLRSSDNRRIHLDYSAKVPANTEARLFDLKGRLLAVSNYPEGGLDWELPHLASGVYFIRLQCGKQNLGSSKLIVLK